MSSYVRRDPCEKFQRRGGGHCRNYTLFRFAWGYDGRILTAPSYGLEDVWRSQYVLQLADFSIGPDWVDKTRRVFRGP